MVINSFTTITGETRIPRRPRVRPSMRQVADAAGVSMATASNALNGTGRLSDETRRRVLEAARELSYLPYSSARAAARGGFGLLGLSPATYGEAPVPYMQIPYYSQLALAAIEAANQRGYLLTVLPGSMSRWMWLTTPLDGVIHSAPRGTASSPPRVPEAWPCRAGCWSPA